METEREYREREEFRTVEDYFEEIGLLSELAEDLEGSSVEDKLQKIINKLVKALGKKENYKVRISKRWYKSQWFVSRWLDGRKIKRRKAIENALNEECEELKNDNEMHSLSAVPVVNNSTHSVVKNSKVEVLDVNSSSASPDDVLKF